LSLLSTFTRWLRPARAKGQFRQPTLIPRDSHNISRKYISDGALKVMARLRAGGFQAYLVGGGVRDLLLGGRPKDFDVATDARPEQVRELFRNSRIIGRRFKIVHVRFGPEVIEVTTFRGRHDPVDPDEDEAPRRSDSMRSESGMLLRDNVYGSVEEDAERRDFTVNALYYTTEDFSVRDYCGGMADMEQRLIRIIGDAETRYREDPVRMLRAIRFAAKLGFQLEAGTAEPIRRLAPMLSAVPAARMFDEVLKLLMAGHGEATYLLMREYGLFAPLFPATEAALRSEAGELWDTLIRRSLHNTDRRIAAGKTTTPAFLYGALLWPALQDELQRLLDQGVPEQPAIQQAASTVIEEQVRHTALPRRFSLPMREIWELQWRFPSRQPRRVQNLLEHPRLRAAYDFLLLREEAGEETDGLGARWTTLVEADESQRDQLVQELAQPRAGGAGSGRRRRRRKPRSDPA
jgi:poly(A) polymerase